MRQLPKMVELVVLLLMLLLRCISGPESPLQVARRNWSSRIKEVMVKPGLCYQQQNVFPETNLAITLLANAASHTPVFGRACAHFHDSFWTLPCGMVSQADVPVFTK
ncbi:unnamed protein product [Polarella glacialis]|uniref:Secreted protein n=1 Tax=Polarella glacialis TaxID=89957 RepID=A0A813E5F1_POLGL|nr:unnamed protein product [Polarella glacialis]